MRELGAWRRCEPGLLVLSSLGIVSLVLEGLEPGLSADVVSPAFACVVSLVLGGVVSQVQCASLVLEGVTVCI